MRRRKKNKKKQAQGFIFPVPLALFLVLVTLLSMSYLWMNGRCEAAGKRIQALERTRRDAHQRLLGEESKWANLKNLRNVERALKKHQIVMRWPVDGQVVRVARPIPGANPNGASYEKYAGYLGGARE